ncbi:MAG: hypothetical protein C4583_11490 [Anaerolineaceae bacterium]|nr:MAG: hypothetical protein C4583_11490 [Anaerolineaceae bacterium]
MKSDTILATLKKETQFLGGPMNPQNKKFPKTPPFVFDNSPAVNEPASQPESLRRTPARSNGYPSERGLLSVAIFLISALSMGIALLGGAWIGYRVLENGVGSYPVDVLLGGIVATGLAYGVGWVVGLFGIRMLGNFILPIAMKIYAVIILLGLAVLQIAIISRLFKQAYSTEKFIFYIILYGVGLVALIGIHLLIEEHSLVLFSFPVLIISLAHLYLIVFHYIFIPSDKVQYQYLWGDAIFFLITSIVGVLMLAHLGVLTAFRETISNSFNENTTRLVPPE